MKNSNAEKCKLSRLLLLRSIFLLFLLLSNNNNCRDKQHSEMRDDAMHQQNCDCRCRPAYTVFQPNGVLTSTSTYSEIRVVFTLRSLNNNKTHNKRACATQSYARVCTVYECG